MDIVERLKRIAKANFDANKRAGRKGPEWALRNEVTQVAADTITALRARCASLEAERDGLQKHVWGLQDKIGSLSAHDTCACSWDKADDVCLHHSPKLTRAEAMCADLAKALEQIKKQALTLRGDLAYREFAKFAQNTVAAALRNKGEA